MKKCLIRPLGLLTAVLGFALSALGANISASEDYLQITEVKDIGLALKQDVSSSLGGLIAGAVNSGSDLKSVAVSGLPTGVKFDSKKYTLSGAPTKAGVYWATISAKNANGFAHSRMVRFAVSDANGKTPEESALADTANVKLDCGDEVLSTGSRIVISLNVPENVSGSSPVKVTAGGLPAGLKLNSYTGGCEECGPGGDVTSYRVEGLPTKAGRFKTTFTVTYADKKTAKTECMLMILDGGSKYIGVAPAEGCEDMGSATKSGVYAMGANIPLSAKANKGYVFAGWDGLDEDAYASFGEYAAARLNPSLTYAAVKGVSAISAKFAPIKNDYLRISDSEPIEIESGVDVAEYGLGDAIVDMIKTLSQPTVSFAGLPAGLKWDAKKMTLTGKATKSGVYYATISAKNAGGYKHSRIVKFVVDEPAEPVEANDANISNCDLSDFDENMYTGFGYHYEDSLSIPANKDGSIATKVAVKGLPAGWKSTFHPYESNDDYNVEDEDYYDDDTDGWLELEGAEPKPGRYTMTITVTYADKTTATTVHSFIMRDSGSRYVEVVLDEEVDSSMGTVSGSGVYAYGEPLKISAKAAKNYVFTGWRQWEEQYTWVYDEELDDWVRVLDDELRYATVWFEDAKGNEIDYRTPSPSKGLFENWIFSVEEEQGTCSTIYATFVPSEDDEISLRAYGRIYDEYYEYYHYEDVCLDDTVPLFYLSQDGWLSVQASSDSLPGKITLKGLPSGIKHYQDDGSSSLYVSDASKLKPGVYAVAVTASNASKKNAAGTIKLVVPNLTSDAFPELDPSPTAYSTYIGMNSEDALSINAFLGDGYENYKVSVSGLPAGVKWVANGGGGYLTGTPTKAGNYTVTFTATSGKDKQVSTITITVNELPAWAVGTFNGGFHVSIYDPHICTKYKFYALATVTIGATGKTSAKLTFDDGEVDSFSKAEIVEASDSRVVIFFPETKDWDDSYLVIEPFSSNQGYAWWQNKECDEKYWAAGELWQTIWTQKDHKSDLKNYGLTGTYASNDFDVYKAEKMFENTIKDVMLDIKDSGAIALKGRVVINAYRNETKAVVANGTLAYVESDGESLSGYGYVVYIDSSTYDYGFGAKVEVKGSKNSAGEWECSASVEEGGFEIEWKEDLL